MRRLAGALLVLAVAAPAAFAAEMPTRKSGLWDITTTAAGRSTKMQQCTDAATDKAMQGPAAGSDCSKRDVQKSGNTTTIDSVCSVCGKTFTSHAVVTGSFDSEYSMTATSEGAGLPGGKSQVTLTAKWLGPCAAGQKPGDMIMANGMKMNILNMPKGEAACQGGPPR